MIDSESEAFVWIGRRSTRVSLLIGAPCALLGVAAFFVFYVVVRELSFQHMGVNIPIATAAISLAPALGLIGSGVFVSRRVVRLRRRAWIRAAAERFNVPVEDLEDAGQF